MDSKKRARILKLIDELYSDESSEKKPIMMDNGKSPRNNYVSPKDRSSYNYGYMDSFEFYNGFHW